MRSFRSAAHPISKAALRALFAAFALLVGGSMGCALGAGAPTDAAAREADV